MKMAAVRPYTCGLDAAADVIGGKWKPRILWALHHGPRRFGELRKEVTGVTEKMLIQQLRELESRNIVHREVFHQVPPKVEYSLTTLGESLNVALMPLDQWGSDHLAEIEASRPC
jgi:DNA-binding HxlR family transcriptional regulator